MAPETEIDRALASLASKTDARALTDRIVAEAALEGMFRAARARGVAPSDLLWRRIDRDARRVHRRRSVAVWSGLLVAGLAGIAFGLADPAGWMTGILGQGYSVEDLGAGYGLALAGAGG